MHFGEYELSPSLIGLSLLPSPHPEAFQRWDYWPLTSPTTATRRFIMQKARRHGKIAAPTACRRTVSGTFSLPCPGCFSPFPHGTIRYRSLTHI